jgi:hypothetical protein
MARVQKLFISYRREDAADIAGRIRDWLVQSLHMPPENVFMDVTTILPGADFTHVIEQAIAQCDAMIVVMSPAWLSHVGTADVSYPRLEAETALRRNLLVIPISTGGIATPTEAELPETLHPLSRLNIRLVRADSFDYDMDWVHKALGVRKSARFSLIVSISAILLALLILGVTLSQVPSGNPVWAVFHPSAPPAISTRNPEPANAAPTSIDSAAPAPRGSSPAPRDSSPQGIPTTPAPAPGVADTVCALSPDRQGVYRYSGSGTAWTQVGGPASLIYGGGYGLFATSPDNSAIYEYLGSPNSWRQVGGPGATWAVTNSSIYGLSPDRQGVYRYSGSGTAWTQVGGPAWQIVHCP